MSVNRYLVQDLIERGLWSDAMKKQLIAHNGSVQYIAEIPAELRELYKTTWEIKQKSILEMAADRAPYICQSQSLNIPQMLMNKFNKNWFLNSTVAKMWNNLLHLFK